MVDPEDGATAPRIEVVGAQDLASRVADVLASQLRTAVDARGRATVALSGGRTPGRMFTELASRAVPWSQVHLFQVDERVAPTGDPARNLAGLTAGLLDVIGIPAANVHPVPITGEEDDLEAVASGYARQLRAIAGDPVKLDVVQLGLGEDGHTASLVPGDPVLLVDDRDVAVTGPYRGHRRVTLTVPVIRRARHVVWMVAGNGKADAVARLAAMDQAIPATHVVTDASLVMVDEAAAARMRR